MDYNAVAVQNQSFSSLFVWIIAIPIIVVGMIAGWKMYSKAGKPGWESIIPIYNLIVLLQIIQKPIWWIVLYFIPFVNTIITLLVALNLAKAFGKSAVFGVVLLWIFPIGYLILGFGSSKYAYGNVSTPTPATPPTTEQLQPQSPTQ